VQTHRSKPGIKRPGLAGQQTVGGHLIRSSGTKENRQKQHHGNRPGKNKFLHETSYHPAGDNIKR
jgi:hypothetical protein